MSERYKGIRPWLPEPGDNLKELAGKLQAGEKNPGFEHLPPDSTQHIDHPSQAPVGIHPFPDRLHVVTVLENPLRWRSRYWNYHAFANMVEKGGGILYTCEIAFGDRPFEITSPTNPYHLQLRSQHELLHKENAINLTIEQRVTRNHPGWGKVATLDADISFTRPDWVQETLQLLEHYMVLQMFTHAVDLGPHSEPIDMNEGFVAHELNPELKALEIGGGCGYGYGGAGRGKLWHPGLAWAWRREAYNAVGGLMDWVMGGSADHYMALGLFNLMARKRKDNKDKRYLNIFDFPEGYRRPCFEWQHRAEHGIRRNVGFMPGTVLHYWHGPKQLRQYLTRADMLAKYQFDPVHHLKRDHQGLWQLADDGTVNFIHIRDGLRYLARLRDEDSNAKQEWIR